jgi:hypothetical protein
MELNKDNNLDEDFLNVDNPVPGQHFVCLSFLSPEKILKNKEIYILHNFMKELCSEYNITEKEVNDKFEDFKYKNEKDLNEKFTENNDFQTNVRGVKIRGTYDTKREADVRAKILQRQDKTHNVFVGQVGYWLPWDPSLSYLDGVQGEYMDKDLNTLMQKYNENQENKDMFFQDMVNEKKKSSTEDIINKNDPWLDKIKKEEVEVEEVEEEKEEKVEKIEEVEKVEEKNESENEIKTD